MAVLGRVFDDPDLKPPPRTATAEQQQGNQDEDRQARRHTAQPLRTPGIRNIANAAMRAAPRRSSDPVGARGAVVVGGSRRVSTKSRFIESPIDQSTGHDSQVAHITKAD